MPKITAVPMGDIHLVYFNRWSPSCSTEGCSKEAGVACFMVLKGSKEKASCSFCEECALALAQKFVSDRGFKPMQDGGYMNARTCAPLAGAQLRNHSKPN